MPQMNSTVVVLAVASGVSPNGLIRFELLQLSANIVPASQAGGVGGNDGNSGAISKGARFSPYPVTSPRKTAPGIVSVQTVTNPGTSASTGPVLTDATCEEAVERAGGKTAQSGDQVTDDVPDDADESASDDGGQSSHGSALASSNTLGSSDVNGNPAANVPALASVFASLNDAQIQALLSARQGPPAVASESSQPVSSTISPPADDKSSKTRKTRRSRNTSKKYVLYVNVGKFELH
ncbi:hypothetical protein CONPUDRAFT_76045 [Coniophora puteana RWD-64-598 SS2]|uniref:Uncharacterized protein n=1 Tax=Coniophora puteana (strain RWD-64-598) TaxID=741705 RepID=A0A5M3MF92_CONPW|nr:uncharacterized protein CONPUDRAFT_76045 [Coniophora puteana RWD-64-598 SS2]EIW77285.1 hypothetical protein CONPUDRAFT_76045 [Coniophora puteana RWD-64-598 SS2]